MPITRLFEDDGRYTAAAQNLAMTIDRTLRPFFQRPHSTREMFTLIVQCASAQMAREQTDRQLRALRNRAEAIPIPVEQDIVDVQDE